ncbi:hypothetical protein YTPLAS72_28970 [Nitrospira sp.]|nr:hypothetical protein YTPLAS72_28970 [Nitrospira sp.]
MGAQWSLSQEEEDMHRQSLFRKARKGDEKAKQELQEVYGVRLWAEHERAALIYENPRYASRRGKQKA